MAFNAFVGGIQPGGLTNDFEVKILICFLLDIGPLGKTEFRERVVPFVGATA